MWKFRCIHYDSCCRGYLTSMRLFWFLPLHSLVPRHKRHIYIQSLLKIWGLWIYKSYLWLVMQQGKTKILTCKGLVEYILDIHVKLCPTSQNKKIKMANHIKTLFTKMSTFWITRTELPSCEAIEGKKVDIAYIVIPDTKLKVGVNRRLLPTLISLKLVANSKLILTSTCLPTPKCLHQTWYQQL